MLWKAVQILNCAQGRRVWYQIRMFCYGMELQQHMRDRVANRRHGLLRALTSLVYFVLRSAPDQRRHERLACLKLACPGLRTCLAWEETGESMSPGRSPGEGSCRDSD